MKVIVDDKIPYIREALSAMGVEAQYVEGSQMTSDIVRDADALIVRTRTHCNAALLEGSRVQFIATATIGYDHIDTAYCESHGIYWTNAPGCNAASVRQYVQSALLLLQKERGLDLATATLGVVGVGHVGTLVVDMARSWGMRVLCCDPPRAERGERGFVSLETIAREADVITLHTPSSKRVLMPPITWPVRSSSTPCSASPTLSTLHVGRLPAQQLSCRPLRRVR